MANRSVEIQDLIDCLADVVNPGGQPVLPGGAEVERLFDGLQTCGPQRPESSSEELPILSLLPAALEAAQAGTGPAAALAQSLAAIAPALRWSRRPGDYRPDFKNGHANARIIGPEGLEVHDDLFIGVSLMVPELEYPEHRHPPEEVYIALSDGEWRQEDGRWYSPGYGGLVYNPSNTRHAMRSGAQPLLAMWCLWPK